MQEKNTDRWKSFESIESLRHDICEAIVKSANEAIAARGKFLIVLAGGNTPKAIYSVLRDLPMDWSKWHIYHGDERCLPINHEDRNSLMANQAWLDHVKIPAHQVHNIPAELGAIEGAKAYTKTLEGAPTFDMVLLGLGEDGHTASLFPNHKVDNSADAVPVFNSPKPPSERVTISQNRLNNTHAVIFMVTGAGKQEAVNNWRKGVKIPATLISPANGIDIYCYGVKVQ